MTAAPRPAGRAGHGGLAFLLSVLLHGVLVGLLAFAPGRPRGGAAGRLLTEQQVRDAGPELGLFLADVSAPAAPPAPPPLPAPPEQRAQPDPPPPAPPAVIPELESPVSPAKG